MGGFDRGFDRDKGSERDKPAEVVAVSDDTVRSGEPRVAVETRTRGEAHADLRQAVESGWDRGQRFEAPRGELAVFQARRAGLPEVTSEEASRYVERHRAGRPWLEAAERASPEAARIIVAADQGGGHGHIRHEGRRQQGKHDPFWRTRARSPDKGSGLSRTMLVFAVLPSCARAAGSRRLGSRRIVECRRHAIPE